MKKILFRLRAAVTAAIAAFKQPEIMVAPHFQVMADMYESILKVQDRKSPLMFQIGFILPSNEKHTIATVWVGAGANSSPVKRIKELCEENEELKRQISNILKV